MGRTKRRELSRADRRRIRVQQVLFSILAILVIASFVITLVTN